MSHLFRSAAMALPLFLSGVLAWTQSSDPGRSTRVLTVLSQPDSAAVYVDSTFRGITPCRVEVSCQRSVSLDVKKEGFLTRRDTLTPGHCADTTFSTRLFRPAVLSISSDPESASVTVGGKFMGLAPVVLSGLPPDTLRIIVSKAYCGYWFLKFAPGEGSRTELVATLPTRPAILNVFVNSPRVSVLLDDAVISRGSTVSRETGAGLHKIGIQQDTTGRVTEMLINAAPGQQIALHGTVGSRSLTRAGLAFLVPGSPQLLDGSYLEGALMLAGSIALGANAILANNDYQDRLSQYDLALAGYLQAPTEVEASRRHDDVEARKSDLDRYYTRRMVSLALFAAGYVYSVVDALLNHLVVDGLEAVPYNEPQAGGGRAPSVLLAGIQLRLRL